MQLMERDVLSQSSTVTLVWLHCITHTRHECAFILSGFWVMNVHSYFGKYNDIPVFMLGCYKNEDPRKQRPKTEDPVFVFVLQK